MDKIEIFNVNIVSGNLNDFSDELVAKICCSKNPLIVLPASMNDIYWQKKNQNYLKVLSEVDFVTPDGMPLVWLQKINGEKSAKRIYGPDLMKSVIDKGQRVKLKHFFYGATEKTVKDLKYRIEEDYAGVDIVGEFSPPFRDLNKYEEKLFVEKIKRTKPDVVWVGMSSPKQVFWAYKWKKRLKVKAIICVGAAFDFNSGNKRQAPSWMQSSGMEWFFRLMLEPRRLWRRYVVQMPYIIIMFIREVFR